MTWKGLTDLSVIPSSSNMLQWQLLYVISIVEIGIESEWSLTVGSRATLISRNLPDCHFLLQKLSSTAAQQSFNEEMINFMPDFLAPVRTCSFSVTTPALSSAESVCFGLCCLSFKGVSSLPAKEPRLQKEQSKDEGYWFIAHPAKWASVGKLTGPTDQM